MKIERLQIGGRLMDQLGYGAFFEYATHLELINTFQYDQNNFFSLERIVFKPEAMANWETLLKTKFMVEFVQPLSIVDTTVVCIAKSTNEQGFFRFLGDQGFWAIIPPISIDPIGITVTIICEEAFLTQIHQILEKFDPNFRVLAINDLTKTLAFDQVLLPQFTERQREIAKHAIKRGYYSIPKKVSAEEIAEELGISVSGFNAHLRKVEARLMEFFFS